MQMRKGQIKLGIAVIAVALAATLPVAPMAPAQGRTPAPAATPAGRPGQVAEESAAEAARHLLGRLDRLAADRRPAALGHVRRHQLRRHGRQGPLPARVRCPLRRLQQRRPATSTSSPPIEMQTIRNYGAIPFFSWGSQSTPVPGDLDEPAFQLTDIIAGSYDNYIREFAEGARDWGHPFFLRFDWEMNGDWFPWAEDANGNQPSDYVAAWRHVHDIFTQVGATNATWVWCPYVNSKPRPGAARPVLPRRRIRRLDLARRLQLGQQRGQPPALDELRQDLRRQLPHRSPRRSPPTSRCCWRRWPPAAAARAKAAWIDDMFKQLRTKYRRIRGLIWFEQVDRGVQWPLETAPAVTKAFSRGIRQRGFKDNDFSTLAGPKVVAAELIRDAVRRRSTEQRIAAKAPERGFGVRKRITRQEMKPPTNLPRRRSSRRFALLALLAIAVCALAPASAYTKQQAAAQAALLGRRDRQAADRRSGALGLPRGRSLRGATPARASRCSASPRPSPTAAATCRTFAFPKIAMESPARTRHHPLPQLGLAVGPVEPEPARLQALDDHQRQPRRLHPRIRRSRPGLGPPLLPPLRRRDERLLVPLERGRQRQQAAANSSPPGATCTTSSPRSAPPTRPGSGAQTSTSPAT